MANSAIVASTGRVKSKHDAVSVGSEGKTKTKAANAKSWEPVYHVKTGPLGKVLKAWYTCPHGCSNRKFVTRHACLMHCKGEANVMPSCPKVQVTKVL